MSFFIWRTSDFYSRASFFCWCVSFFGTKKAGPRWMEVGLSHNVRADLLAIRGDELEEAVDGLGLWDAA